jgi:hypothetical protein
MTVTKISLKFQEFDLAINTARLRMAVSIATKLKFGAKSGNRTWIKRFFDEVIGVCGEIAVAKLGKFYFVPGLNEFHIVPDVFRDVEVRSTDRYDGCLVIRDNDVLERRFILAIVNGSDVVLAGWIYGTEGAKSEYLRNPNNHVPAWFIPINKLRPMETFNVQA